LLQAYFTDRLMRQRNASPNTVASHRDAFRLLLGFAQRVLRKPPTALAVDDLTPSFLGRFLDYLEQERGNVPRSRNVRLAAIHSFFSYVALQEPGLGALAQQVLAIPGKRYKTKPVDFLTRPEIEALLAVPDQGTWSGRRDRTLLLVATQTGLRVSELVGLCCQDVVFGTGAHVRCTGKGRKERCTPLRKDAVAALRAWLRERHGQPAEPLFPNARGHPLSRDGVEYLLAKHAAVARIHCPSMRGKRVSPHVLRHYADLRTMPSGMQATSLGEPSGRTFVELERASHAA
jgi:site-specific recombinase XerD